MRSPNQKNWTKGEIVPKPVEEGAEVHWKLAGLPKSSWWTTATRAELNTVATERRNEMGKSAEGRREGRHA